jgi:phage portal protein BeeE
MKLTQRVEKFFQRQVRKAFDPLENINLNDVVGWKTLGGSSIYGYYHDNQYENGYSSIRVLTDGFASVEPFTVDKNGNKVNSNILDRLYTPNSDMSAYDFREALMVTTLVHDKVRLRVHYNGDNINVDSITGFTFMEGFTESIVEGKRQYLMPNGLELDDSEVITLKAIDPSNVTNGFSPSRAARRWTRLDDYIADYQKGFFENGAVPSGEMIITARTQGEFNDIVDVLQAKHKGAGKNNNISYVHRPTDQNGSPLSAQVEWIPFASPNKDMGLKELFENVNKKIDSVYGVPAEIRGFLSNSNYASVGVAEKVLVKYALYPKTLKIWSKFNHELNRITGGLGVAVDFQLDIPVVADEEKVKAESKQIDATTVTELTTAGYTLDSAIEYIETGEIKALKQEPQQISEPEVTTEDIKDTPDQPIDIYAKSLELVNAKLDKVLESKKVKKQLDVIDEAVYQQKFSEITKAQMSRQVEKAIDKLDEALASKAYGDTTEEEDKIFTAELLALMLPLIAIYGNRQVNTGMNLIVQSELSTTGIERFNFTPAQRKAYETYLARIGTGYAEQTAQQIRQILGQGILDGATKAEIEANLRTTILGPQNEYRVRRLAVTELNTAEAKASVSAMENIQSQTGHVIQKRKVHFGTDEPCEFCKALLAEDWRNVSETYLSLGKDLVGTDGGIYVNNWRSIDSGDIHANGHCGEEYRVLRS